MKLLPKSARPAASRRCAGSVGAALALAASLGCGPSGEAPPEVPVDQASAAVKSAFAQSADAVKQSADAAAQEMSSGNYLGSYGRLDELSARSDLTPEQRQAVAESQMAVMKKISEAAAAGDANAAQALEVHRARK